MKLFKILFIFSILLSSSYVFASNLSIDTNLKTVKANEIFTAILNLNTEGESINTIEGDIIYDKNFLKVEKINIGNSFINFWVERPNVKTLGLVNFSGITPGGVVINKGEIFSIIFRAEKEGSTLLSLKNVNLFINDGKGTLSSTRTSVVGIKITKNTSNDIKPVILEDKIIPEKFSIIRTQDSLIYDNKYFAIFNASDKETGIDHYKICEYWSCIDGSSPYLLKYQGIFYYINVSAYDGNGNMCVSKLISPYLVLLILIVFLIILFFYRRYLSFNDV